ncbi:MULTISPECIES: acetoacetate--CoA ligase [Nocardiaceae]|uniref:Acetoacetyl-CoA synthetase n=1 Tax=Rhodococcoides corynebacterioides TaxID=53972 RepID=A0ABS2KZT2_9NOCA|nr:MULTISPECIES: acetoacetate--CoA ligase [Rhodococcus]MBM7417443.1 acetoacetyl-CoA synthetase [Rhodococcus corynebacterioides]MBP1115697.1 acetoacetyl-CoA synthetase [Rhodococcus sp. PvP016]
MEHRAGTGGSRVDESVSPDVVWSPTGESIAESPLRDYLDWLEISTGRRFPDHDSFWSWSIENLDEFWVSIADYHGVAFSRHWTRVRTSDPMPDTRWFVGARLNWAENMLLRGRDSDTALVCASEIGAVDRVITFAELRRSVAAASGWLRRAGVRPGDRVAAYLPNTEHAVIGVLAAATVGAVWVCCSPDFGPDGTISRLSQLEPTVLIAVDGYHWNGKDIDRSHVVAQLRDNLPSLQHVVHVPYLYDRWPPEGSTPWADVVSRDVPLEFEQVDFSHPLWVLFSSGTTGLPKGLVHGHGGIVLESLKWSGLYCAVRAGERLFTYTSTGWALWNMQLGALSRGASIVLYEGSPGHPAGGVWEIAARTRANVMLLGAAVVSASAGSSTVESPGDTFDMRSLRHVMVSGSSLPAADYRWVGEHVGSTIDVDSTSGGTDIAGSFVGGNAYTAVRPGRIGGRIAGVAAAAWSDEGIPLIGEVGDLVITEPMPSMPLRLWNDPDGSRYRESYFDVWPGVWRHGDWVTVHADQSITIHGRSDSTLNRAGVRLGSSDFYDVIDGMPEVADSVVVGVDLPDDGYWLGLFVVPAAGRRLDDRLRQDIAHALRTRLSPRHVPDEMVEAPSVPRTLNGKKLEIPIKKLLAGRSIGSAVNIASVDDPTAVRWYADFAASRFPGHR